MEAEHSELAPAPHRAGVDSARGWYPALAGVAALGSLDIAQFIATNRAMFSTAPGRAGGSVLGLGLWLVLTALAGAGWTGHRATNQRRATLGVAAVVALGSVALTGVHAAVHVGGLRPALGGVLGVAALGLAVLATRD